MKIREGALPVLLMLIGVVNFVLIVMRIFRVITWPWLLVVSPIAVSTTAFCIWLIWKVIRLDK